ncbi:MAG: DUF1573 domain-containing protein [Clostridia bacterium]|jgi:hypothetical protein|nr:DUF1573 domain-containing protein [Clostridiales bacterium]
MKDSIFDEFQNSVPQLLIRHKSILDVITKSQESNARVNRAIAKAVTNCGCLSIDAKKQVTPSDASLKELTDYMDSHIRGGLCESCRDVIETELGASMFYMAAICSLLDMDFYNVMQKEYNKIKTLGIYNML